MRVVMMLLQQDFNFVFEVVCCFEEMGYDGVVMQENCYGLFLLLGVVVVLIMKFNFVMGVVIVFLCLLMVMVSVVWDFQCVLEGCFFFGIGSQVKGYIECCFSVLWSVLVLWMSEYVCFLCVIFCCWQFGERFVFEGKYYNFFLMMLNFVLELFDCDLLLIMIVVVGLVMFCFVGCYCDGVWLYGFCMCKYFENVVLFLIEEGMQKVLGGLCECCYFQISGGGFVVMGVDDEIVFKQFEFVW